MSRIQCEFTIDLPCEIGKAWNTPVGRLAVGAEGLEERRTVTRGHPGEDGQVKLQCAFPGVEYPSEVMAHHARDLFNGDLGHQVEVDLGTDLGQPRRQNLGALVRGVIRKIVRQRRVGEVCQAADITQRLVSKRLLITQAWMFALSRIATAASTPLPTTTSS